MAQSRSGKSNKSTSSRGGSTKGRSGASRGKSGGTTHKTTAKTNYSRRAQRRQERLSVMWSIPLAGFGLLAIAMVLVPGQSAWNMLRGWLFGTFGIVTYFVGPLLLYTAYLVASGYLIGKFTGKTMLLALLTSSVPVVFSDFTVRGATFAQVVKMLFTWGQTRFWGGGVLGGVIGASLLALCGRPAANILMALLFLVGLMVFFAVTPLDVVQFLTYQVEKQKETRAAAAREAAAYDTPLFSAQPEEEPIENLTGNLAPKPGRQAFDVAPYLESDKAAPATEGVASGIAARAPLAPAAPARPGFDVDLGPDSSRLALEKAIENDPLKPVSIGPGGTFGMDPLEHISAAHPAAPAAPAYGRTPPTEDDFELHLEPEPATQPDPAAAPAEDGGINDLIRRAMENTASEAAPTGETRLDLSGLPADQLAEDFSTSFDMVDTATTPGQDTDAGDITGYIPPLNSTAGHAAPGIPDADAEDITGYIPPLPGVGGASAPAGPAGVPSIGGSFEVAKAAWNAGIPITQVLAGQATVPLPGRPQASGVAGAPTTAGAAAMARGAAAGAVAAAMAGAAAGGAQSYRPARPAQNPPAARPAASGMAERNASMGNSASDPIHTPPAAAKATPAAQSAAAAAMEALKPYCYPSVNLFNAPKPEDDAGAAREMKKNAEILVHTLDSFGVNTKILDICRGPSVTRYELQPQAGVKISRITNLSDDIALNLATAGVRIEAPIPGKPAVGIEVPNRIRSAVNIRGVFESTNYINMRSPLTMALGKDIAGSAQVADLCKMPHLLVAGSTGSGKSVCINSIIISFLFRSGPEDVKLLLIDPKVVELAEYNGIPHLLMPVVTEPRKAAGALGASVAEMERRYKLFAENNVRDIKTYNKLAAQNPVLEHLPYIAIVIDELADLMMVAGKEVEDYICRIAQKARAAGIHLIIATQRPSVDVITGLIKANIPSRIAFAVSSQIDSRTILDGGGAEKLLGNGDMLFMPVGAAKPTRIQGTFVTDEEISAVLSFIKTTSSAQYDEDMIAEMERRAVAEKHGGSDADDGDADSGHDAMFDQAVDCVIEAGQASTSLLQRRCKLGYARAARIMDQMEQEHVIGPYEGAKPRSVLVTRAQWQERKIGSQEG